MTLKRWVLWLCIAALLAGAVSSLMPTCKGTRRSSSCVRPDRSPGNCAPNVDSTQEFQRRHVERGKRRAGCAPEIRNLTQNFPACKMKTISCAREIQQLTQQLQTTSDARSRRNRRCRLKTSRPPPRLNHQRNNRRQRPPGSTPASTISGKLTQPNNSGPWKQQDR